MATTGRERILLVLTIVGFIAPNVMLGLFIADNGIDLGQYFGDWFGTLAGSQITVDIFIAAIAFMVWTCWDGPRSGVERWWLVFPASFLVGICFGLPLYLLMREKAVGPDKT